MAKSIAQNASRWKPGQSGNPKGRTPRTRALTELLRSAGEAPVLVGGEAISAQEALAKAVWQFAVTGEVWLMGNRLAATSVTEWAHVVKWLYNFVEPPTGAEGTPETEMVVRVVRADKGE